MLWSSYILETRLGYACSVAQASDSCNSLGRSLPGFAVHGIPGARGLERVAVCRPPVNLPDTETEPISPVSPALQMDSLTLSHWGNQWETENANLARAEAQERETDCD